jgi:ribosome recycling factor
MKTEHTAAPAGPAFHSIKDVESNVKARMEKAIGDLQHEAATIRTGRAT